MSLDAVDHVRRSLLGACACALLIAGVGSGLHAAGAEAANRRCAPVVTSLGPGFTKASVLIVTGRVDCEKSRRVIFKALSTAPYEGKEIAGWDCRSTRRGGSGVYGARCTTEGEKGEELIKSTLPRRCPGCHKIRD